MELKRDHVLFINLICRMALLLGFMNEWEKPSLDSQKTMMNWNSAVSEMVVLIFANGLRDDFLRHNVTPYMQNISENRGVMTTAMIDGFVTKESGMRVLLTGQPSQSALLFWNRPKYSTIIDFASCKCICGELPLKRSPQCYYRENELDRVLMKFDEMVEDHEKTGCLYIISFDIGPVNDGNYLDKLIKLDGIVRHVEEKAQDTFQTDATFIMTSSRGDSPWNRTEGNVDAPVLIWGKAVLPVKDTIPMRQVDIPVLVSTLLGRSFPAGSTGVVPTYFLEIPSEMKFHILLYNSELLDKASEMKKSLEDEEYSEPAPDHRLMNELSEEDYAMKLKIGSENFLEKLFWKKKIRMALTSLIIIVNNLIWGVFIVLSVSKSAIKIRIKPVTFALIVLLMCATYYFLINPGIPLVLLAILGAIAVTNSTGIFKAFAKDGPMIFFTSTLGSLVIGAFAFLGAQITVIIISALLLLWPFSNGMVRRSNRKILLLWFVSGMILPFLHRYLYIGKNPSRVLITFPAFVFALLFQIILRVFKRRIDTQGWIILITLAVSTIHQYTVNRDSNQLYIPVMSRVLLSFYIILAPLLSGTLLDAHLKMMTILFIPYQLLTLHHETVSHLILACQMISWLFLESVAVEKNVYVFNPSIFTIESTNELLPDNLTIHDFRQAIFFIAYCFTAFFAVGNIPSLYSYDLNIARPFTHAYASELVIPLVALKFFLPYFSIVFSLVTLTNLQKKDPAPLLLLSISFSDVISSCLLTFTFIFNEVFPFDISYYMLTQIVTIAVTALYFLYRIQIYGLPPSQSL